MNFYKLFFGFALLISLVVSIFWDNSEETVNQTIACNETYALNAYEIIPAEYLLGLGRAVFWYKYKDSCKMFPLSELSGVKVIHRKTTPGTTIEYSLVEINGKRVWVKSTVLHDL